MLKRIDYTRAGKPSHRYELDGRTCPGVTTILNDGLPKPALTRWAARTVAEYVADNAGEVARMLDGNLGRESIVGALAGVPWDQRDAKASRGTDVHHFAEDLLYGRPAAVGPHALPYVDALAAWLDENDIGTPVLSEVAIGNRDAWYAGTLDAILVIRGTRWLVDWKTSPRVYGEGALQLAAYAAAEVYVGGAGIECVEVRMPEVDELGIVHVTPDGARLHPVTDRAGALDAFLAVRAVARRVADIPGLIGEAA